MTLQYCISLKRKSNGRMHKVSVVNSHNACRIQTHSYSLIISENWIWHDMSRSTSQKIFFLNKGMVTSRQCKYFSSPRGIIDCRKTFLHENRTAQNLFLRQKMHVRKQKKSKLLIELLLYTLNMVEKLHQQTSKEMMSH